MEFLWKNLLRGENHSVLRETFVGFVKSPWGLTPILTTTTATEI
jgi:hypothetical protein